ncbi:hypothetical protein [Paracidovorax citrulli]
MTTAIDSAKTATAPASLSGESSTVADLGRRRVLLAGAALGAGTLLSAPAFDRL